MIIIYDNYAKLAVSRHRMIGPAIKARNRFIKEYGQGFKIMVEDVVDGAMAPRDLTKDEESVFRVVFKDF